MLYRLIKKLMSARYAGGHRILVLRKMYMTVYMLLAEAVITCAARAIAKLHAGIVDVGFSTYGAFVAVFTPRLLARCRVDAASEFRGGAAV